MKINQPKELFLVSLGHFLVDFFCAYTLLSQVNDHVVMALVVYNFLAFAMQMPLGLILDNKPHFPWLILSIYFCLVGILRFSFWLSVLCLGMGNALYHLSAGKLVMDHETGCSALGIFVAPGAFGISLGTFLKSFQLPLWLQWLTLAGLLVSLKSFHSTTVAPKTKKPSWRIVILLFVVVALRSFVGMTWILPWKAESFWLLTAAVVLGKALGGIYADQFNLKIAARSSLLLSALFFVFSDSMVLGLVSILLFNMSMPLCLKMMIDEFPDSPCFAFGILTFALFIGYTVVLGGITQISKTMTIVLILVSLIALWIASERSSHD